MYRYLLTAFAAISLSSIAWAQGASDLKSALEKSESLRRAYRFDEAIAVCDKVLGENLPEGSDSSLVAALEESRTLSKNGEIMLGFCSTPQVVAKKEYSLKDFFLYYPLPDESWLANPCAFNPTSGFPYATYAPKDADKVYFSAKDEEGTLKIYSSEKTDSAWTAPSLLGERLTSWSDDAFPFISGSGNTLYFASKGLFGVGGYDLYSVTWNSKENEWGEPENLGFPYSSPFNDYLFVNSPDGKYSVFASDRECSSSDSVYVYVLEFDAVPVRSSFAGGDAIEALCNLDVPGQSSRSASDETKLPADVQNYVFKLRDIQNLKNDIAALQMKVDGYRAKLSEYDGEYKNNVSRQISEGENEIMAMRDSLEKESSSLQKIEMDLLSKGTTVDPSQVLQMPSKTSESETFSFVRHRFGADMDITFMKPKSSFDYSFKILKEGQFAEDNTLPDGLFYQIQIFSRTTTPATEKDLRGLSPVFSRKNSGKTTYFAGLFRSYNDALSNLAKVKRAGFKTAFIVAVNNGQQISVADARKIEKNLDQSYQIRIVTADGKLSDLDKATIKAASDKDMIRETVDGETTFVLGPFPDGASANSVLSALRAAGMTGVSLETLTR